MIIIEQVQLAFQYFLLQFVAMCFGKQVVKYGNKIVK